LREGGSLPAIVEADDDGLYVLKFRGAGQGARALVAELVAGELGRVLGLPVPELVFVELDPVLGRSEPDPEIQALLEASGGLNLGVGYLPGALPFNPLLAPPPEPVLAAAIVWFDAYVTNVDRTARNTNLLLWGRRLWLIDHGAALYFHHRWEDYLARSQSRFPQIKEHVLLPLAGELAVADATASRQLTAERLAELVALIPDDWLAEVPGIGDAAAQRLAYRRYLEARLAGRQGFVEEAAHARAQLI
jgi:hypothetical protein